VRQVTGGTRDSRPGGECDMLILTRKRGTEIVIDGRIRVAVLKIGGGQVRLGISAPASVPVFRREVLDRFGPEGPDRAEPHSSPTRSAETAGLG
jgi:carbon storage regulator